MKGALVLVLCVSSVVNSSLLDFLRELPSEIGNSVSSVWNAFKDLVKKPVRIKRLGSGGPRKTTSPPTRSTTKIPANDTSAAPAQARRLTLPVFAPPTWQTLHHWNRMQKPKMHQPKIHKTYQLNMDQLKMNQPNIMYRPKMQQTQSSYADTVRSTRSLMRFLTSPSSVSGNMDLL